MKRYIKIDDTGIPIESRHFSEGEEIPECYVEPWEEKEGKTWWEPIYDKEKEEWIESLTLEEIEGREREIEEEQNNLTNIEQLKQDNQLLALALMDLAEIILNGGVE